MMYNVYRAMMFATYPHDFIRIEKGSELDKCDYLYTVKGRTFGFDLEEVWSNKDYAIYRCDAGGII